MDDTIRSLIRFVSRGFYSTPYVLILDAVLHHSVLSEDDLIHLLSIKRKELRSLCNKLVDDRLMVAYIQKEENGQQRLITRTYFYVHITAAIDSIKWKVHSLVNLLKQEMSSYGNPQGYLCPRCGNKVSQLDAISLLSEDKTSFICDVCQGVLVEDDSSQQASLRQAKLETLMMQVDPIIGFLKRIDDSNIQDNDFESALLKSIPAQSTTSATYSLTNRSGVRAKNMSSSLQSAASKAQATLRVSITADDENYEREQLEKERRRAKLEQNALPSWHSNSTVGESTLGRLDNEDDSKEGTPTIKEESDFKPDTMDSKPDVSNTDISSSNQTPEPAFNVANSDLKDKDQQDALAAYYAQLAQQDDDDDDEDDDDDDFDNLI
ncbi:uncharacterized protein CANTADRAFT_26407 [Suhomyces tanzawaensis NRRL Y-17324]|uniref:HTH TFE/IIEalpha-type domain-containing protein n=1 Tax=Suhomyces tanzawaensis NRRL Y-17324 TaxID=984487 RepID=A0A1E4SJ44_9ASCO|nr:uncharacterized protein CANTADRAFT_26407 [Suhomyces tanzawaensis NRRL Y-17324]ODV79510.1 hypothetical protein CANTADRAFT_26407 [Suhomyces tanzawaensis NRRL Y-17324]